MQVQVEWVTKDESAQMNFTMKGEKGASDVFSFPTAAGKTLGNVFISPDFARNVAKDLRVKLDDLILRYAVHGLYHLLGYDHQMDSERKKMFASEEGIIHAAGGEFISL